MLLFRKVLVRALRSVLLLLALFTIIVIRRFWRLYFFKMLYTTFVSRFSMCLLFKNLKTSKTSLYCQFMSIKYAITSRKKRWFELDQSSRAINIQVLVFKSLRTLRLIRFARFLINLANFVRLEIVTLVRKKRTNLSKLNLFNDRKKILRFNIIFVSWSSKPC